MDRRGNVIGWDEDGRNRPKIGAGRSDRLRMSFEVGEKCRVTKNLSCFFIIHPPILWKIASVFTQMARGVWGRAVVYSHCHGEQRYADSVRGSIKEFVICWYQGITWNFVRLLCCRKNAWAV